MGFPLQYSLNKRKIYSITLYVYNDIVIVTCLAATTGEAQVSLDHSLSIQTNEWIYPGHEGAHTHTHTHTPTCMHPTVIYTQ